MEGDNKPMSYEERHEEGLKKEAEKQERMERIRKDTIARLQTDPAIQEYLSQFGAYWVEPFITGYAHKLMMTHEYGNMYSNMHEEHSTEYMERAEERLKDIQMKKLFDMRCQWGANAVKYKGIETSADFYTMSDDIMNCTLVPPITQQEFDLYMKYARSPDFVLKDYETDWNSYCDLRTNAEETDEDVDDDDDDDDETLPPWFIFHNTYTGSDVYMTLPDLRGDKEDEYRDIFMKDRDAEWKAKEESGETEKHVQDDRPRISDMQYGDVLQFMQKFEKPETVRLFENMVELGGIGMVKDTEEENDSDWYDEQVESIIHNLSLLPDVKLPIEAHTDWRLGLIAAWEKFEKQQTVAALPTAYNNYLFMLQNKIAFASDDKRDTHFADSIRKQIIRGRELNGEPGDLDF